MTDKRDISSVDVAVVVSSCDAYSDAWEPFFHSFFKYWPDCPFPVYLVAREKTYDDSRVKTIRISEKNWSVCMKTAFAAIPEHIILYLQEDYFLKRRVDTEEIIHYVDILKKERAACLRLYPDPGPDDRYKDYKDIGSIGRDAPYRLSLQAALWDKKALDDLLIAGEDPWQTEFIGSKRAADVDQPFLSVKRNSRWRKDVSPSFEYVCTAIIKGRWTHDAVAFCKREGIDVDLSRRPMERYGQHMRRHMSNLPLVGGLFKFFFRSKKKAKSILRNAKGRMIKSHRRRNMRRFYRRFLAPGDLCFDIGANMGNRTRVFEGLGAKVIALEPQSRCFNSLVKEFGGRHDITILKKAVGSKPGFAEIMESDVNTISSMSKDWIDKVKSSGRFKDHKWSEPKQVEVVTLDQLIGQYGLPSFCKIDVEGYEDQVIGGLSKKIPALSFEFTPEFLEPAIECVRHISQISDYEFNYSLGESMKLSLGAWVDGKRIVDIIKGLPKEVFGDVYARIVVS